VKFVRSPSLRMALGLLSLALTLLLASDLMFRVFPLHGEEEWHRREHLAQRLATEVVGQYNREPARLDVALPEMLRADPALRSIGLRLDSGKLVAASPGHETIWRPGDKSAEGNTQFVVSASRPRQSTPWAQVEVAYQPMNWNAWWSPPVRMLIFFSVAAMLFFALYLRRAFHYLDPGKVVPQRVQMAFDALSEGVIVLDQDGRIVMSNRAFDALTPDATVSSVGRRPQDLAWLQPCAPQKVAPWVTCMERAAVDLGIEYEAASPARPLRKLIVNCSPVVDDKGRVRGCVISFTDVTALDAAHRRLVHVMEELRGSKEQLERQNVDLRRMATEDPMTGTMNRRAFFPLLDSLFEHARRHGKPLTVLMADIDRFKAINDIYGHAAGDRVIQGFAAILKRGVRQDDIICRYGGEEFCIALPGADAQLAATIAERLRAMAAAELGGCIALGDAPMVTASFGIAQITECVPQAPQLVDQADQALYRAKRSGRNQVVRFEPEGAVADERA
jgi:diguanylate cyclase (GGDEF)-like protein